MHPKSFVAKAKLSNRSKTGYFLAFQNAAQTLWFCNNIHLVGILRNTE